MAPTEKTKRHLCNVGREENERRLRGEGENADEDEQCKGQTRIRKFSPIRNGGNNHDFGQSNPPSDQNTEDSSEDIDIVMKEENGAGGAMEKMRCGLMANENLLHNTDGKGGMIAHQEKPWNEQARMSESSPFVNGATNHDLGQSNPTSDQNTEDLKQNIDTEMNEENGIVETMEEMSSELMENGCLIHKTDGKEGVIADQGIPWNEQMGMRESSPFVNGATNHDLGQSNPTSDQNTEDLTQNIDTEMDEEKGIVETIGEMSSELMENGSLIHKTDGKEGENADEDEQCKGQTRIRKFSPIRNGGNNHDFGQSNPPSDQNTEDSSEDIDIVIKEENGAGGAMEKMRCGLLANESLLHNTDGKGGGNADADEKWNERKRMRKNSGTGNNVNNHGIRQGNPSSDPHTEHSPESSDAVMKGKQGTMKNIGMTCELKEKEKQIEETDWKED
ncbi:uncharacterized protein DDB_G0290685-like isoform X3 [Chiloscyllium plagiosum]|uniref:uncharacterized protein DDB_G0290685-like isoform X3 n=1 Tax=Chiloscyllium plagiosum TaxID=36176 RepID=UPI001CB7D0A7|nr:uncharacterized protein DDB_G0290685-like isoform X3 [Chiloscyllium plagiosum]